MSRSFNLDLSHHSSAINQNHNQDRQPKGNGTPHNQIRSKLMPPRSVLSPKLSTPSITMQVLAILALAATALAAGCTPGTYSCAGTTGWQVCDVSATWVVSYQCNSQSVVINHAEIGSSQNAGTCPTGTTCSMNKLNNSPYCT